MLHAEASSENIFVNDSDFYTTVCGVLYCLETSRAYTYRVWKHALSRNSTHF